MWCFVMEFMLDQDIYLRTIIQSLPDGIYFKDLAGRFVLVNNWMVRRFGVTSVEDFIGKTDFDFFAEEHAQEALEDERQILETRIPVLDKIEHEVWSDGHETWVSTSKVAWCDSEGKLIGTFGTSRDITIRVRAEQKLNEAHEEMKEINKQLHEDLVMASEIQKSLMIRVFPSFSGPYAASESLLRFNQKFLFSGLVGGDFCDVIKINESQAVVLMGDVMGHGVQAALIVSMIRAICSQINRPSISSGIVLEKINRGLLEAFHGMEGVSLISAGALGIDLSQQKLEFSNAGHYVPFRISSEGQVGLLFPREEVRAPILGIDEEASYPVATISYERGDRIVFFTDGFIEVENSQEIPYGEERLRQWFERHHMLKSAEMIQALEADLMKYSEGIGFQDDIGLLIIDIDAR